MINNLAKKFIKKSNIYRRKINKDFAGKINTKVKNIGSFIHTKSRHFKETVKQKNPVFPKERIGEKESRERIKRNAKSALPMNEEITRFFDHGKRLVEGSRAGQILSKIFEKPWARRTAFIGAGLYAFNLIEKNSNFMPSPAIPDHYDQGYDLIKETMTDFGSPVSLAKTASKTLTPYFSTVRKSITTTTRSITEKNLALFSNKHAIRHTRY